MENRQWIVLITTHRLTEPVAILYSLSTDNLMEVLHSHYVYGSNEAILWLHVQMTFYTQSQIVCLNVLNLWFMIMFHTTCFCRLYKKFCVVMLLDDCMQIQSDIDSIQGWLLLISFISRAAKLEAVTCPGRQTLSSLNTTWCSLYHMYL